MKIIAVAGTKNTGKTTLVTRIVTELVKREFKVGTLKHAHHTFDRADSDTGKHREAGAELVAGVGFETFFTTKTMELEKVLNMMKSLEKLDFVVLEGFKNYPYAKISTSPDLKDEFTIKNVNAKELSDEDVESLVDLITERSFGLVQNLNCKKCGFKNCTEFVQAKIKGDAADLECKTDSDEVLLRINDKPIPLNPFVRDFVRDTVEGMFKSLKTSEFGVEDFEKIELLIRG
jgi:molybdopterin-guanine dinucleotide biosynthesis adapter protein